MFRCCFFFLPEWWPESADRMDKWRRFLGDQWQKLHPAAVSLALAFRAHALWKEVICSSNSRHCANSKMLTFIYIFLYEVWCNFHVIRESRFYWLY